ncbi:MAG: sensor histidine kinase [Bacteroidota bacterium]|nr:sensor histidine kinase [Bacteroidota bacterium]
MKSFLKKIIVILTVSFGFGLFFTFLFSGTVIFDTRHLTRIFWNSSVIGIGMWLGNDLIGTSLTKKYPWERDPKKALRIRIICSMGYSVVAVIAINLLLYYSSYYFSVDRFIWKDFFSILKINGMIILLITFIIITVVYGIEFFKRWNISLINEERMQKEIISYQYEMLRNQVNPHFLFNSLNILTSLVENDPPAAVLFIRKLSEVYRYILDMKEHDLVSLDKEIKLVRSYIFMQKYRYGENLIVDFQLENTQSFKVIPVSVQMLIENAIKHNIITEEKPLSIKLYIENDYLICENTLQKKQAIRNRNGLGLNNIKERYSFFDRRSLHYGEEENKFVVKLPLIKNE